MESGMIKFRVEQNGQWQPCEGGAAGLKLVFSHNIDLGRQRPEAGQYLGDPQRPAQPQGQDALSARMAGRRYREIEKRLTGVYIPG
jgi:hypothetical protein